MAVERFFPQRAELHSALAKAIAERVEAAVAERGAAGLVVTGGSTPAPLYDALTQIDAPWDKATITLSDERWVETDSPASNEGLVRRRLLQGHAAAAQLVGLKTDAASPAEALPDLEAALAAVPAPYEVVVLGMGGDCHIASLFPGAPELEAAFDAGRGERAIAIHRPGADGSSERVSLTLRALLDTRLVVILIEGDSKREAYARALTAEPKDAPVAALLQQTDVPVEIWWAP